MSKPGIFTSETGRSLLIPFILVSSLFFLWGFCNGMIDVMDKHFQKELGLTLAQSAWVQFAHYLGYFLMAMPAGWLASKLGYKGGIIAGLLMVAVGGFWFIEATKIAEFWAFLLGVCVIASGLTFLETVANPYSTVLGPKQFAATRINLSQTCNGIGWVLGPWMGAKFFYGKDASGASTGSETLWIPYVGVAVVVLILAIVFFFCNLPDIKSEDEFHLDDKDADSSRAQPIARRGAALGLLWLNVLVLSFAVAMIISAIVAIPLVSTKIAGALGKVLEEGKTYENPALLIAFLGFATAGTGAFLAKKKRVTNYSIWSHPHFSGATLAQFFYVAAQCGIFAYFINYMTKELPAFDASWSSGTFKDWFEVHTNGTTGLSDSGASKLASYAFVCFLSGRFIGALLLKKFPAHKVLTVFALLAAACCALIFPKLGWISGVAVFISYFFMSIMFPTIFSLGIHGLGSRAKKASSFIVMAIMGGAIMPKFMGHIGDVYGMSHAFMVPGICFLLLATYAFFWSKLSGHDGVVGVDATKGH
jgi:FHS family L-fucose permease-like MFS transporter